MATSILLKFLTLKWNISRTIWRIEVGDGSLFCIFHALSFELNYFFDRRFRLTLFKPGFFWLSMTGGGVDSTPPPENNVTVELGQ